MLPDFDQNFLAAKMLASLSLHDGCMRRRRGIQSLACTPHTCPTNPLPAPCFSLAPQLEHILLRPDTYIGSTEKQEQALWVHDGERMVHKVIKFVPGLYKIFDEILVNAADNKVRDPTMDSLRVDIDPVS